MLSNGETLIPINTKIRDIIRNWEEFYGQDFYYRIHPYLMFFITYVDKTEGKILYDIVTRWARLSSPPHYISWRVSKYRIKTQNGEGNTYISMG